MGRHFLVALVRHVNIPHECRDVHGQDAQVGRHKLEVYVLSWHPQRPVDLHKGMSHVHGVIQARLYRVINKRTLTAGSRSRSSLARASSGLPCVWGR